MKIVLLLLYLFAALLPLATPCSDSAVVMFICRHRQRLCRNVIMMWGFGEKKGSSELYFIT